MVTGTGALAPASFSSACALAALLLRLGRIRRKPRARRGKRAVGGPPGVEVHHALDDAGVHRRGEGLPQAGVVEGRAGTVEGKGVEAQARHLGDAQRGFAREAGDGLRRQRIDQLQRAAAEIGQPHRLIRQRAEQQAVEIRRCALPVSIELFQDQLGVLGPARELPGAAAHGARGEIGAQRLYRGGRDHHARAVGQHQRQRRVRGGELDLKAQRPGHGHAGDGAEIGTADGADGGIEIAVDIRLGGGGVQHRAVMEG
jgi:hypothetical protein